MLPVCAVHGGFPLTALWPGIWEGLLALPRGLSEPRAFWEGLACPMSATCASECQPPEGSPINNLPNRVRFLPRCHLPSPQNTINGDAGKLLILTHRPGKEASSLVAASSPLSPAGPKASTSGPLTLMLQQARDGDLSGLSSFQTEGKSQNQV